MQPRNPKIDISNKQKKITINKKRIYAIAKETLRIKNNSRAELSILFVGTKRMQTMNKKFRNIDRPTDVLAFSMREGKDTAGDDAVLGDVVICPEIAKKYAQIYKTRLNQEIQLDLIHGILHLLGYKDSNSRNQMLMQKEQQRIFKKIGIRV